jgi:hypothetical protein
MWAVPKSAAAVNVCIQISVEPSSLKDSQEASEARNLTSVSTQKIYMYNFVFSSLRWKLSHCFDYCNKKQNRIAILPV